MKNTIFTKSIAILLFVFVSAFSATAQTVYRVGDKVRISWGDVFYTGEIVKVDGEWYRIHYDGFDSSVDESVKASRFVTGNQSSKGSAKILARKYVCFSSEYNQNTGMTEFTNRGSVIFYENGKFEYLGNKQPSPGSYTETGSGVLQLKGGYMDGGRATPIPRPNKFYLVFPNIIGNRWTCEPAREK